jgi:predicted transcriptional regulator
MTSITIAVTDDLMVKLKDLAKRHNVAPEDLVRASVEELVASPEGSFHEALDYILQKNETLYKRLSA